MAGLKPDCLRLNTHASCGMVGEAWSKKKSKKILTFCSTVSVTITHFIIHLNLVEADVEEIFL